jgi:hypothetical protein
MACLNPAPLASPPSHRANGFTSMADRITTPPWLHAPFRWVTVDEFATRFNKSPRRIRTMCLTGDILCWGIRIHQSLPRGYGGNKSRWWLELPDSEP